MKFKKKIVILLVSAMLFQVISPVLAIINDEFAVTAYAEAVISNFAFDENPKLKYLEIPAGISKLNYEFVDGANNIETIEIPETVTEIVISAFINMDKLKEINVDDNNPNYSSEDGILYNKQKTILISVPKGRTSEVIVPNTVTKIEKDAFSGCNKITKISMNDNVTSIGENAFYNCTSLVNVKLSNSIEKIEKTTFKGCENLTSLELPNAVTEIGSSAFMPAKS